jgi:hypothetical protein
MKFVWGSGLVAACAVLFAGVAFAGDDCNTDYNGDGTTDAADVAELQGALGTASGDDGFVAQADHDGDGFITVKDYAILLGCN